MNKIKTLISIGLLGFSVNAMADSASDATNLKIEEITQMLQDHPEVVDTLHQSLSGFIAQQQGISIALQRYQPHINSAVHSSFGEAENPQLTIVNVTDYNCPYCKKLDAELEKLVKDYPQVKVINIYVPLKERNSKLEYTTASYALNVWRDAPDKFQQVNDLLAANPRLHNERSLKAIADKTGTQSQLVQSNVSDEILERNNQLFLDLGLRGTPAMIINDQIIPGYLPYPELKKALESELN